LRREDTYLCGGLVNPPVVAKPLPNRKRVTEEPVRSSRNPKLYLYPAGALLFLILAGYAFAQDSRIPQTNPDPLFSGDRGPTQLRAAAP
jgi:hypothetical protein